MGRFYSGDIEGKFWFGIQSSNDADFFGGYDVNQDRVAYEFEEDQKEEVKEGVNKCLKELGQFKQELDTFFKNNDSYNETRIVEQTNIETETQAQELLTWYARLELGEKILKSLEETGECYFEGEC